MEVEPRYVFIKFKDETTVQASEISRILPVVDKQQHHSYVMILKDGSQMSMTKKEYDALLKAFDDATCSVGLVVLEDED